ncbi:PepSY domain-containing protein [Oxalobacter sp. OttesenSCG-928-P03]|nr:PepSY domain-containing protein [Oxalobacter sp. OttesenSCG-928-P03]
MTKQRRFTLPLLFSTLLLAALPAVFATNAAAGNNGQARHAQTAVSAEKARQIALDKSGGGDIVKCQSGRYRGGVRVYHVVVINQSMKYIYKISAETGEILYTTQKRIR